MADPSASSRTGSRRRRRWFGSKAEIAVTFFLLGLLAGVGLASCIGNHAALESAAPETAEP